MILPDHLVPREDIVRYRNHLAATATREDVLSQWPRFFKQSPVRRDMSLPLALHAQITGWLLAYCLPVEPPEFEDIMMGLSQITGATTPEGVLEAADEYLEVMCDWC